MSSLLYIIAVLIIVLLILFLLSSVTYCLRRAYLSLQVDMEQQRKMIKWVFSGLLIWLLLTAILSAGGYFSNYRYLLPRLLLFGLFPFLVITVFLLSSKRFTRILSRIPPSWLVRVQCFRLGTELALLLAFLGDFIPFQMTFLGFNMDVIVGITALFAGRVFFRKSRFFKPETVIWNIFGILLILNQFFIILVSAPTNFRIFFNEPGSEFITGIPFIWIPTFILPFALVIHIFSIKQVFIKELRSFE